MVEVAGVEPASLETLHTASTCLVAHLNSLPDRRVTRYRLTSIKSDDTVPG